MADLIKLYGSTSVTLGSSSVSAPAVSTAARGLRIVSTVDVWISLSGAAVIPASIYLPAGHVEYLLTAPGTIISAVPDGAPNGTVNISEIV